LCQKDIIQGLTENTNQYRSQKTGTTINTNTKGIKQMIGMYMKMCLEQMSGVRMYWEPDTWHTPVSDVILRHRFQSLLTSLHFFQQPDNAREEEERQTVETQIMALFIQREMPAGGTRRAQLYEVSVMTTFR